MYYSISKMDNRIRIFFLTIGFHAIDREKELGL